MQVRRTGSHYSGIDISMKKKVNHTTAAIALIKKRGHGLAVLYEDHAGNVRGSKQTSWGGGGMRPRQEAIGKIIFVLHVPAAILLASDYTRHVRAVQN